MRCPKCGTENAADMNFCKKCGNRLVASDKNTETQKGKSKKWLWIILILVFVLIISGVVYFVFFRYNNAPEKNENGITRNSVSQTTTIESTTIVPTTITESTIQGMLQIVIPDVVGLDINDAKSSLTNIGLKCDIKYDSSRSVPKDYVVSQFPVSGRETNKGETIILYVSKGNEEESTVSYTKVNSNSMYFNSITASSTLSPEGDFSYGAENLRYNDSTCWCEGVTGMGNGEYITFSSNELQSVSGIQIINGYAKSTTSYYDNSRVKKIQFEFSDGSLVTKDISDSDTLQKVSFGKTINTTYIKMTILDTYSGDLYDDTCISYIRPY